MSSVDLLATLTCKDQPGIVHAMTTAVLNSKGNIIAGASALSANKAGTYNIAIGENSLSVIDSGSNNIAIGINTLTKMVVGGGGQHNIPQLMVEDAS